MIEALDFLAAPLAACLLLVAILGYLGIHVLERKVIFVDLALAQIAALGAVIGYILGYEPGSAGSLAWSLGAASAGAAIFSLTRLRREVVPHEALIGITYVLASALTLVVADRAPEGAEHIKELLAGAIIWVSWPTVIRDLVVVAAVGAVHFVLRRRFILISRDPEAAFRAGLRVRWWDFQFYLLFGLVITIAVEIGGILMVFSYLVAPAIVAIVATGRWATRLAIAWGVGALASALGLFASYRWDLPAGPAVVCMLGALLVVLGLPLARRRRGRLQLAEEPQSERLSKTRAAS